MTLRLALLVLAGAGALTAPAAVAQSAAPLTFKVVLHATASDRRTSVTTHRVEAGCEETTTTTSSIGFRIESTLPSLVRASKGSHGEVRFSGTRLRHLVRSGGGSGPSGQTRSCTEPGKVVIIDPAIFAEPRHPVSVEFARFGVATILFRGAHSKASPPLLDLSLASGTISKAKLFDRDVPVITAVGDYDARIPVKLENGTMRATQRVHWRLTFTRVS